MTTWILVAHRAGAQLYERTSLGSAAVLLESIDHPQGRLRDAQLGTDKLGGSSCSTRAGRRPLTPSELPHEHVATVFAKRLATRLDEGRQQERFQHLVLIAEPRMLGALRRALDAATSARITHTAGKDLAFMSENEIATRVAAELARS